MAKDFRAQEESFKKDMADCAKLGRMQANAPAMYEAGIDLDKAIGAAVTGICEGKSIAQIVTDCLLPAQTKWRAVLAAIDGEG